MSVKLQLLLCIANFLSQSMLRLWSQERSISGVLLCCFGAGWHRRLLLVQLFRTCHSFYSVEHMHQQSTKTTLCHCCVPTSCENPLKTGHVNYSKSAFLLTHYLALLCLTTSVGTLRSLNVFDDVM